ncbi:hypothetical protein R1flu_028437 [Riccia fluitans]|uniref:PilZ domain-containing protein n=1 Tax=Riccia fluitans TaxID=41844 RepID=A0ABD1XLN6_9MARC
MNHSLNLDKLDQEASTHNIDRLVEVLEMEARESRMSKCRKLFSEEASTSAVEVYQPPTREDASTLAVQVYQPLAREEASTSAVQFISPLSPVGSNIGTTFECIIDLSAAGLRKLVDFPVKGECRRIVPPSEVEAEFLKQIGRKYKKDALQDIAPWFGFSLTHSQSRSEGWVVDDFKKYSLEGHPDGYALDKQVRLVINQVQRMVEVEQRTEAVRLEKEALQQQYAKDKAEWEKKNTQLIEEVGQLHEEKKRNAAREG